MWKTALAVVSLRDSSDLQTESFAIFVDFSGQLRIAGIQFINDIGHAVLSIDIH